MAKKPKARTGRPSSYKPEYAEALIKHMGAGYSFESFAAVVGRNRDTMYEWVKQYPDFSDAKKKGTDLALLYWESLGLLGASGKQKGFNVVAWIFNMKNRFGWRNMDPNEEKKPE